MEHFYSLNEAHPDRPSILTIGSFDGVHRGHQELVETLVYSASTLGFRTVVFTFFPHPSVVLKKQQQPFYINRPQERAELLGALGIDWVITHPFDNSVRKQSAKTFLERLRLALDFRELWCGPDFALGHQREGNIQWLHSHGPSLGYKLNVIDAVMQDKSSVSSSRIRRALRSGDIPDVTDCLGRNLRIPATVIQGDTPGQSIDFPTANLAVWEDRAYPQAGVYACFAHRDTDYFESIVNIGYRPSFHQSRPRITIEAHLLDQDQDLHGHKLYIDFVAKIRSEMTFDTSAGLSRQIHEDISQARNILAQAKRIKL